MRLITGWRRRGQLLAAPTPTAAQFAAGTGHLITDLLAGAAEAPAAPAPTSTHPHSIREASVMTIIPGPDGHREATIKGLRDLADYLEAHPDLPVARDSGIYVTQHGDDDTANRAEVNRIANILGVTPEGTTHYGTRLDFGPVYYRTVAVSTRAMQEWNALHSYSGAVQPEQAQAVAS